MNYIAYHQGDELFPNYFARHGNNQGEPRPQITKSTPEPSLKKMLVAHPPMPDDHSSLCYPPIKLGRGNPSSSGGADVEGCKKKVIHRDVERQRRHEMATLYASLRTLLPLEYLKGKRSISDHMNEAANYIKHQQKKIHELTKKRDGLRRRVLLSSNIDASTSSSSDVKIAYDCAPSVAVRPCWAGVEVVITAFRDQTSLSTVIMAMEEEGLAVVSCSSTYVQNRCYHTVKSEVTEVGEAELRKFEQKLNDLVLPSNWFFMKQDTGFSPGALFANGAVVSAIPVQGVEGPFMEIDDEFCFAAAGSVKQCSRMKEVVVSGCDPGSLVTAAQNNSQLELGGGALPGAKSLSAGY